ncbi:MAG: RdgB/HAM1 family non-canonical purine NTP pyrophosphatase [Bacilli bacterium]|nr:RdgB/HAM1 family non-canonical purine NTP pyrophosphatase [Bacilli bacterium]
MEILFATKNQHKLEEVKKLLRLFTLISLNDLSDNDEVEESKDSFYENAYLKARYYYDKYHMNVFADDSGLVCEALHGEPGVHSARFSGNDVDYDRNNELLLRKMQGCNNRKAYFVSVICFINNQGNAFYFEGKWEGEIALSLKGNNGFGYDPLFYISHLNKTAAELSTEEKNKYSHRSLAFQKFSEFLEQTVKYV